jgi:hypothetical protein
MNYIDTIIGKEVSDGGKALNKPGFYGRFYDDLLSKYIGLDIVLVELGIGQGGSLQMWRDYLGPKAMIYGIDVQEKALYDENQIKCFYADTSKPETVEVVPIQDIDVFIDDGSHVCKHVIDTFEIFFPRLKSEGLYVIEDVCTSYRPTDYGGGYREPKSTIEYFKGIVDVLNLVEWNQVLPSEEYQRMRLASLFPSEKMMDFYHLLDSVTFYNGTIVIKRH